MLATLASFLVSFLAKVAVDSFTAYLNNKNAVDKGSLQEQNKQLQERADAAQAATQIARDVSKETFDQSVDRL